MAPEAACAALAAAGFAIAPADVRIAPREERWAVFLPGDRIAWFPMSERGHARLAVERRVLALLAERCSFRAPRVIFDFAAGYDIRVMVAGHYDPWLLYEQSKTNPALARAIGGAIGAMLAEQHTRILAVDVEGWLPESVSWPEPSPWIRQRRPAVIDDRQLIAALCSKPMTG